METDLGKMPDKFIIVGENIHATRVFRANGKRVVKTDEGSEAVTYIDRFGNPKLMGVPDWFKQTQSYKQGQIKHFLIAMTNLISDDEAVVLEGEEYIQNAVYKQIKAGADYIDINVDEVHYDLEIQKKCMARAIEVAQKVSSVPISIDSSNSDIIESGLKSYKSNGIPPLINSVAFERPEVFEMALSYEAKIIAMATSETGMPEDENDRIVNAKKILEKLAEMRFSLDEIYLDAIVFPISVNSQYGNHYFDAVRKIREEYGSQLHIGMGLSNVSFGMPMRKLINQAFIYLGLESGIDAGLIDPLQIKLVEVYKIDTISEKLGLAIDMLTGKDEFCVKYLQAYRDGKLQ